MKTTEQSLRQPRSTLRGHRRAQVIVPLPPRVVGDRRLSALHFRVLAAIAMHDRMSHVRRAGQGCWATNQTLATEATCDYARLSSVRRIF